MKSYFENGLIRFLYWPKTALFGNRFQVLGDDKRYRIEKRPQSSRIISKIVAVVLYPFFTPFAFLFSTLNNLIFGTAEQRKNLVRDFDENHAFKDKIKQKINPAGYENKNSYQLFEILKRKRKALDPTLTTFQKDMAKPSFWSEKENIGKFNLLLQYATDDFAIFLLAMQKIITERDLITTEEKVSHMLTATLFPYFTDSLLIRLYRLARTKSRMVVDSNGEDVVETPSNCSSHDFAPEFYTRGTKQNQDRKTYNICIKQFCTLFGKDDALGKHLANTADKNEDALLLYSRIDTSKNETSFFR